MLKIAVTRVMEILENPKAADFEKFNSRNN
jgi:hypothetical protein